jgi:hypothetical protein
LYEEARGKYLAVCPGDDHWIDPEKLQLQVELMESRPELAACFTNGWNERDGVRTDYVRSWLGGKTPATDVQVADVLKGNFIPACTFLFRRDLLFPLPQQMYTAPVGDYVLTVHLALKGPIGYIDRHTAVRHGHAGGIIAMKDTMHKIEVNIGTLEALSTMVKPGDRTTLHQRLIQLNQQALQLAIDRNDPAQARPFWKALQRIPGFHASLRERLRRTIQLWAPGLSRVLYKMRRRETS